MKLSMLTDGYFDRLHELQVAYVLVNDAKEYAAVNDMDDEAFKLLMNTKDAIAEELAKHVVNATYPRIAIQSLIEHSKLYSTPTLLELDRTIR
jgi:hypothetical protein